MRRDNVDERAKHAEAKQRILSALRTQVETPIIIPLPATQEEVKVFYREYTTTDGENHYEWVVQIRLSVEAYPSPFAAVERAIELAGWRAVLEATI